MAKTKHKNATNERQTNNTIETTLGQVSPLSLWGSR